MESAVNWIALPNEMLEIIFSYCTHSDLVQSIQKVCCRWREVAQSARLWKDVIYCPQPNTRYDEVVKMLELSPKLQNIILEDKYDFRVLQAITDNCGELRNLEFIQQPNLSMHFIKNLQKKCPKVQYLSIPYEVLTDLGKSKVVGKFTNLRVLHLRGYPFTNRLINLSPIAYHCTKLEDLQLGYNAYEKYDLFYLLSMRKGTLHTLGISCHDYFDECVLPVLSTCELKSLSLFRYSECRDDEKVEHLGRLKTVKTLSITSFSSEDDLKQIFENENMAQLVELSLEDSPDYDDEVAEVIARNCPLLKCLSLKGLYTMTDATLKFIPNLKELNSLSIVHNPSLTDTGIIHLQDVKSLKQLTIVCCKVGLGNIAKLRTLQHLSLEDQDLAEFPWDVIPHHMQHLECLDICHCRNVDMCAIEEHRKQLPSLKVLNCY